MAALFKRKRSSNRMAADKCRATAGASAVSTSGAVAGRGPGEQMPGSLPGQMKLALQILLGDLDITQRHVGGAVAKQFHQRR